MITVTESQLFGEHVRQTRLRKRSVQDPNVIIRDLTELQIGSAVVHIEHGVGRYQGLQTLEIDDNQSEFLVLTYADNDRIYVPVTSLHLISRYSGSDIENAPLHKLGSDLWSRTKRKAAEKIHDVATELLDIYAKRQAKDGFSYQLTEHSYHSFASIFPFEETPDQTMAIQQVITDMQSKKTMDRLICGDVGFGKTEVAMRAAFIAVQNNKQVAILVPTTLLASQHYVNFCDRFADFPVTIGLLSRFNSKKEREQTTQGLNSGAIDIVIGTHKLIQKSIQFHNLGLLIIDEEHRFGVRQKEFIKSMRTDVDILTLTATPIPRTLNMAMSSLRDISIIATPPAKRLAIKTFCQESNKSLIREAILREIMRGGQAFYLYNNVDTIQRAAHDLSELVPEATVNIAHGQMRERELEQIMLDFYHHRFNVIVCTTIIETGIDIPTANTIIINRADRFGLAQLHQLRGRVGRSHHQAYAYLLTPDKKAMTKGAVKRLEAIMSLDDLGAGFTLATHDLEIRGAGELLGDEQSGNMHAIGFNLYMELLDKAVEDIKSGKAPSSLEDLSATTEVNCHINTIIPEDYITDVHIRLTCYKRIANASDKTQLRELQVEFIDRFGLLPESVKNLFRVTEIKLDIAPLGIQKLDVTSTGGCINFVERPKIEPNTLINLIQHQPQIYKFASNNRLRFYIPSESTEERFSCIDRVLKELN